MRTFGWSLLCAVGLTLLVAGNVMGLDRRAPAWALEAIFAREPAASSKKGAPFVALVPSEKQRDLALLPVDPEVHAPSLPEPEEAKPSPPPAGDAPDIFGAELDDEDDDDPPWLGGIVSGY